MNNNNQMTRTHLVPRIMLAVVMFLEKKTVETTEFILRSDIDLET